MQGRDPGSLPQRAEHPPDRTDFQGTECRHLRPAFDAGDPVFYRGRGEAKGNASVAQGTGAVETTQKGSVAYQVSELPSAVVREEDFAKQLRLARYLAGI